MRLDILLLSALSAGALATPVADAKTPDFVEPPSAPSDIPLPDLSPEKGQSTPGDLGPSQKNGVHIRAWDEGMWVPEDDGSQRKGKGKGKGKGSKGKRRGKGKGHKGEKKNAHS